MTALQLSHDSFERNWIGAIHSTKISENFGPKLNGSVRSNRKSFENTGPPFEVDHFSRSDRLEFWLNGSRPRCPYCASRFRKTAVGRNFAFQSRINYKPCLRPVLLKFWFQADLEQENSANYYRQERQMLLIFLTMVTRWSRSTSNFYALIGQNLTSEFMRKMSAASGNLFTIS